TPFYQELSLGAFNGDNELAFGRGSIRDPLVTSRLRNFFELGENGGALQVDITGATGVTDQDRRNNIAGLGLKYKWFPLVGYPFPVITLAGEAIYGNRTNQRSEEQIAEIIEASPGARVHAIQRFESLGYYLYGQYDWSKRWAAGLRHDWTQFPTLAKGEESAISPYLTFKPSEFLRFRLHVRAGQLRHRRPPDGPLLRRET
ncbi:MAG: hypothetical protein DMD82_16195, partial [Candidatus Rokuibacteriota bacterium]